MYNNFQLNFEKYGVSSKLRIVVIHGWGHSLETIKPLAMLLEDLGEIYLIDLPGHGKSENPPHAWGMADFAGVVANFIEEHKIAPVVLLGHSVGGKTAIKLASLYPNLVQGLVLINSSGLRRERSLKSQIRIFSIQKIGKILKFLKHKFKLPFYENWFLKKYASADYKNAGPLRDTLVKIVNEHLDEDIKKIDKPTLLLWSENDTETPLSSGEKMARMINGSKLVKMKAVGHVPWVESSATTCAYHIKNFIKEHFSK